MSLPDLAGIIQAYYNGKPLPNNGVVFGGGGGAFKIEFRWAVANFSDTPSGKFGWVGVLYKDGVNTRSSHSRSKSWPPTNYRASKRTDEEFAWKDDRVYYDARLLADVGDFVDESNEANNKANFKLELRTEPW
ncbi:MAG: hypothetical protein ACRD1T_25330 [Acidimicrobiia bacterium]